jgi:hypothetical protein
MMLKTMTSLAFATTCLTAIAIMPAAAQMSGGYGSTPGYNGTQGYPGSTPPNAAVPGNYVTQPYQGNIPSSPAGTNGAANAQMSSPYGSAPPSHTPPQGYPGSTSAPGNYVTQPNQGNMSSSSAGTSGAALMTNGPQASQSEMSSSPSARQNVIQSQRYDRALETNRGFRQARIRKECGPISDPQLRQSCLASFNGAEPSKGSSGLHHHRKHSSS